ncbi:MAG: AMP-binding protein [Acidobacteria bacterium]|nr:AMP-binding protein [Acidobacteriota bacterium]
MNDSFCQRLIESCERHAARPAMRIVGDETEVYNYKKLLKQVRSVAFRLGEENVDFGDRVALIGENHPCWAIAYLATLYRGAVCVPIDPHGEIETITNFLENSETKLAFLSPEVTAKFAQIEEKLGRHIPTVVWRLGHSTNGFQSFEEWTETDFPEKFEKEIPAARGADTALLMYTSGTTGTPKGVPLSHGNICSELDGINEVLKLTEKEKVLSLLPLFHAYLQIVNLWVATTYGCEVGYLKELTPDELSRSMKEFKPTLLTTVPRLWYLFHKKIFDAVAEKPKAVRTLFKTMLAVNGFARKTLKLNLGHSFFGRIHQGFGGSLRFAVTAGSRFDEAVAEDFDRLGFTIIQGYGLTETSGAATATYENDNRVGSVGKPFFNAEVKIDEPDSMGVGEVLIRGEMVFAGYYKNPAATAEVFTDDGWFRSGDLGKFDRDGHLYIVGRKKDVIVLPNGKNVHPEDLEVHYLKTPLVEELAILGVEDKSVGKAGAEKLVAVVVPDFNYLKQAKIANSQTAIRFELDNLGRELPEYQRVREYIVRAEPLPRTATRKIKRFELQKEIKAGMVGGGEKPPEKEWKFEAMDEKLVASETGKTVVEVIRRNLREAGVVHPDMNLEIDLGLDSLARAEIFAALESIFKHEIEPEQAAQALTVRDLVGLLENRENPNSEIRNPKSFGWSAIVKNADDDLPELRKVLQNRPLFTGFAFSVYKVFNLFCRGFMRLEVQGRENLLNLERPFLICPNHQSFLDPFVLCSNYDYDKFKNTFHVGASEFFENRFMKWVANMLQVVPVDPDVQLMKAMKAGAIGLKNGKILNIYPEGERGFDGELHEFKKGAAILATELGLPILPVALDGLQNVWARRSWRIRPAKVRIRFGKPFYANEIVPEEMDAEQKYAAVTSYLKETIADMINDLRK